MTEMQMIAFERMEHAHEEMLKALNDYVAKINEHMLDYEFATDGYDYEDDCENLDDLVLPVLECINAFEERKRRLRKGTNERKKPKTSPKPKRT